MQRILILLAFVGLTNCKEIKSETELSKSAINVEGEKYPEAFIKVLEVHGGLENWKKMHTLTFEIAKPNAREKHIVDLHNRRD